jgi:hypothetical protein
MEHTDGIDMDWLAGGGMVYSVRDDKTSWRRWRRSAGRGAGRSPGAGTFRVFLRGELEV